MFGMFQEQHRCQWGWSGMNKWKSSRRWYHWALWQADHEGLTGQHKGFGFYCVSRGAPTSVLRIGMQEWEFRHQLGCDCNNLDRDGWKGLEMTRFWIYLRAEPTEFACWIGCGEWETEEWRILARAARRIKLLLFKMGRLWEKRVWEWDWPAAQFWKC